MGYDGKALEETEAEYLATRCPEVLARYYFQLLEATGVLLSAYMRKKGLVFSADKKREVIHDTAAGIVEYYLKHPERTHSLGIHGKINMQILHQLHSSKARRWNNEDVELDADLAAPTKVVEELDPMTFVDDIRKDSRVEGKRIIFDLYTAKYYRSAIKRIALYTPKPWMYNHATQLATIFRNTRDR